MRRESKINFFRGLIAAAFAVTAISSSAAPVVEGGFNGGGGKGGVCRNADGSIRGDVFLLDLWESEVNFNRPVKRTNEPLEKQIQNALNRLVNSLDPATAVSYYTVDYWKNGRPDVLAQLQRTADRLLLGLRNPGPYEGAPFAMNWSRDARLEPTPDSYERVTPRSCPLEQIVRWEDDLAEVRVDLDLVEKMPTTDLAALIVHEAFYKYLRDRAGERNSLRLRRAVGLAFSGYDFKSPDEALKVSGAKLKCESANRNSVVYIYAPNPAAPKCFTAAASAINKRPMIGLTWNKEDVCIGKRSLFSAANVPQTDFYSLEEIQKLSFEASFYRRDVKDFESSSPLNRFFGERPKEPKSVVAHFRLDVGAVGKYIADNGAVQNLIFRLESLPSQDQEYDLQGQIFSVSDDWKSDGAAYTPMPGGTLRCTLVPAD